ncbi:5-hydroxytryptamine receptor 4-like [Hydractinia symbiolongicarpus]|uniref:5-hydroxytryptamine receptor 4-like n=1 Tax=Hydractinia symbiolongicarpus TaxID=13093 RepID=UPI00254B8CFE|nr:5-hydroxytryptamine receptor 4-like [Hydractinia symbiolongicarpus]
MSNNTHIASDVVFIPDIHRVVLTIAYSIIAALGVPANLMILIIIIWNKKLRQLPLNQYIVTLAFTDLLTCGLSAPFYIFSLNVVPNSDILQSGVLCKGFLTVTYSSGMLTVSALAALSLDRCLAIIKPYLYHKYITSKKVFVLNICLLIQVVTIMLPASIMKGLIVNNTVQGLVCILLIQNMNLVHVTLCIVANVIFPLLLITLCNTIVFKIAKKQYKKITADLARNRANTTSCSTSVMSYSARTSSICTSLGVGRAGKIHVVLSTQVESENKPDDTLEERHANKPSFEVTHPAQEECDGTEKSKTNKKSILHSLKRKDSKHKEKDLKSSISRFKFQYRIYISTLSMIILLFILWSPFPVIRVMAMLSYNELATHYGFLYSTLGTTILSLINPFVIFITRREFQKYACFKQRKITP